MSLTIIVMRKMILAMLASMMALGLVAQDGPFTVKGSFKDMGDSVYFYLAEQDESLTRAITGEMQEVTFDINKASMFEIGEKQEGDEAAHIVYYIAAIPGETLTIWKDADGVIRVGGSQVYMDYQEAQNWLEPSNKAIEDFMTQLRQKMDSGAPQEQVMDEYQTKMPQLFQDNIDAVMSYIKAHPDQEASAALIAEMPAEAEAIEAAAALLTERVRGSMVAELYKKQLEIARQEAAEEAKKHALEGQMAPDFTLNDINGKPLALSSLRGKWVIIDFWGSWCVWCIKGMPKMKEYYAKYSSKLEILGVDCNDTVEKWKDAVAQHELPWLHVYWDNECDDNPMWYYGVQGFPTKVVVDPNGQVAKVIIGEDPKFYDFLDEVLK